MENIKCYFSSIATELAEEKNYLLLTSRLCYYGEPNLNGVILPVDGADEKAKTLVGMPVVAKYKKINNKDDLGGHECYVDPVTEEVKFGTESVGCHLSVEVKDDTVAVNGETKTLPCLFATAKIWKRNKNVANAVKRLFDEGKLHSSWEISSTAYTYADGLKTLDDYYFDGNCLLGSQSTPAYPCADSIDLSSAPEQMIAEAMALDMKENGMENKNPVLDQSATTEPVVEPAATTDPVEPEADTAKCGNKDDKSKSTATAEPEKASLTQYDLKQAIDAACNAKIATTTHEQWNGYVSYWFPADNTVWFHKYGTTDMDFLVFTYTVEDDVVTVSEPQEGKLTVAINQVNATIEQTNSALASANEKINEMTNQIAELSPFKAEHEKAEAEKAAAEKKQKQDELSAYLLKSKLVKEQELSTDETVKKIVEDVDKTAADQLIASRFMSSLSETPAKKPEVKPETASVNLKEDEAVGKSIVQLYLGN